MLVQFKSLAGNYDLFQYHFFTVRMTQDKMDFVTTDIYVTEIIKLDFMMLRSLKNFVGNKNRIFVL